MLFANQPYALLKERTALAAQLWKAGIRAGHSLPRCPTRLCCPSLTAPPRAEYTYAVGLSVEGTRAFCAQAGLRWLVVFRARPLQTAGMRAWRACAGAVEPLKALRATGTVRIRDLLAKVVGDRVSQA